MLSKSFKSSKCKTSLKLATSRIKLMKNKKGLQMVQMKRELAQLLDSGQDRTARIRYRTIPEKQDWGMLRRTFPAILSPASILTVIIFSFLFQIGQSNVNSQEVTCSTTCVAQNCNTIGIRYGKYCGVGWSGCLGEKPCDDLDACCKVHDDCVGQKGMNNVKCHEKFKRCIKKVQKSGKPGFSTVCPVDVVVPTMDQGMDMAIMFSQFGNSKLEL